MAKLTEQLVKDNPGAENEQRLAQSVDLILSSLQPLNRSRLYSANPKTDLENRVANRDTNTDLFQTLEVDKTASDGEIQAAYENKKPRSSKQPPARQKNRAIGSSWPSLHGLGHSK